MGGRTATVTDWAGFCIGGAAIPDCDAALQNALHCGHLDIAEELMWQVDSPQPPDETKVLFDISDEM